MPDGVRFWDGSRWTAQAAMRSSRPEIVTFPFAAVIGAVLALAVPLIASRYLLRSLAGQDWPVFVYVALAGIIGYTPSLWWCREVSRRWGSGHVRADLGIVPRSSDWGWGPLTWVSCFAGQAVVAAIILALDVPFTSNTRGYDDIDVDRGYKVALLIVAVVVAPIVEEMLFRGVMLRGMLSIWPATAAVIVQAALFGMAHFDPIRGKGNIGLILVLSVVGGVLGGAAYLFRRIVPGMIAHAMINAIALTIVFTGWTPGR